MRSRTAVTDLQCCVTECLRVAGSSNPGCAAGYVPLSPHLSNGHSTGVQLVLLLWRDPKSTEHQDQCCGRHRTQSTLGIVSYAQHALQGKNQHGAHGTSVAERGEGCVPLRR